MFNVIILGIHILGSVALFALFVTTLGSLVAKRSAMYKKLFYSIGATNVFQLVTGFAMFLSPENTMSGQQFCARIGFYVFASAVFASILHMQIQKNDEQLAVHFKKAK